MCWHRPPCMTSLKASHYTTWRPHFRHFTCLLRVPLVIRVFIFMILFHFIHLLSYWTLYIFFKGDLFLHASCSHVTFPPHTIHLFANDSPQTIFFYTFCFTIHLLSRDCALQFLSYDSFIFTCSAFFRFFFKTIHFLDDYFFLFILSPHHSFTFRWLFPIKKNF